MLVEISAEVLKSTTVSNTKIVNDGFKFQFPDIKTAISDILFLTISVNRRFTIFISQLFPYIYFYYPIYNYTKIPYSLHLNYFKTI